MKKLYVKIGGISCDHCRKKITLELLKLDGIEKAFVDVFSVVMKSMFLK